MRESVYWIADRLCLFLDDIREAIEPVIAEQPTKTKYFDLKSGDVAGIRNIREGFKKEVTLDLRMHTETKNPYDSIRIIGTPDISLRIEEGIVGDQATAAILVNSIPTVIEAVTVQNPPVPWCRQ